MSAAARARLAARVASDYQSGGHRTFFIPDLNDVATVATECATNGSNAVSAASQAAASLASALAITGGSQAVGSKDTLGLPRTFEFGTAAFLDESVLRGNWPTAAGAAYQILLTDYGKTLIAESGTLTWTLPLLSDLVPGWWVRIWNRSGNNLTVNRSGSDVIGSASTSLTVSTNTGISIAYRDSTRFERIA